MIANLISRHKSKISYKIKWVNINSSKITRTFHIKHGEKGKKGETLPKLRNILKLIKWSPQTLNRDADNGDIIKSKNSSQRNPEPVCRNEVEREGNQRQTGVSHRNICLNIE